jgi:hypothetical protein
VKENLGQMISLDRMMQSSHLIKVSAVVSLVPLLSSGEESLLFLTVLHNNVHYILTDNIGNLYNVKVMLQAYESKIAEEGRTRLWIAYYMTT